MASTHLSFAGVINLRHEMFPRLRLPRRYDARRRCAYDANLLVAPLHIAR